VNEATTPAWSLGHSPDGVRLATAAPTTFTSGGELGQQHLLEIDHEIVRGCLAAGESIAHGLEIERNDLLESDK
jgi:hypothetical protein